MLNTAEKNQISVNTNSCGYKMYWLAPLFGVTVGMWFVLYMWKHSHQIPTFSQHEKKSYLPCNHTGTVCKAKGMFAHTNSGSGFMDCLCLVCKQLSHSLGMLSLSHHAFACEIDHNLKMRQQYRSKESILQRNNERGLFNVYLWQAYEL